MRHSLTTEFERQVGERLLDTVSGDDAHVLVMLLDGLMRSA
jgi:hypothetical protein